MNSSNNKVALVTGITGQDGSYLLELLIEKNYTVYGVSRSVAASKQKLYKIIQQIQERFKAYNIKEKIHLVEGDLKNEERIIQLIKEIRPDEIYNLGAQSQVRASFDLPLYTADVDALGTLRILDAIRRLQLERVCKFYQASSSEMFGKALEPVQSETTPFYPRSPYGVSKLFSYWSVVNYREAFNIFAVNGILFNHESTRRGEEYVTRKITMAAARIKYGLQDVLFLGNLDSKRDWGHAKDYVEAMWLMLQNEKPQDYVIASGETHSIREFCEIAFSFAGFKLSWKGEKGTVNEYAIDEHSGKAIVKIEENLFRPTDIYLSQGNPSKAEKDLGWRRKISFCELVKEMVEEDLKTVKEFLRNKQSIEEKCLHDT
jgi:GDPmannose 4,6-dehydratase